MAIRPQIVLQGATALTPTDRVGRYPKHTFNVEGKPFAIVPIGIAPVLPGETLNSIFMESRVVSDPIKNPLIGWKKEYFYFYIKATTVYGDAIRNMFVNLDANAPSTTPTAAANSKEYYTALGGSTYLEESLRIIIANYFRDVGEAYNVKPTIGGYWPAQIRESSWMDSLTDKDLVPDQLALDAAMDTGDLDRLFSAFEQLRSLGLANITYEEYLASFGITPESIERLDKPILLFHTNDFQYPSNTINPADGTPSSAVSWVFRQGENKKKKFFKEPGFIIGCTVTRPKVYFSGLAGNMTAHLQRAWEWLPELLIEHQSSSLKKFDLDTGPLGARLTDADAYFADMRDLFLHGDQFQNRVIFDTNMAADFSAVNGMALPDALLNWRYPTEAMVNTLFKAATGTVKEDGYFSLSIQGKQRDATPNANLLRV
jgi:hypothetical protein